MNWLHRTSQWSLSAVLDGLRSGQVDLNTAIQQVRQIGPAACDEIGFRELNDPSFAQFSEALSQAASCNEFEGIANEDFTEEENTP